MTRERLPPNDDQPEFKSCTRTECEQDNPQPAKNFQISNHGLLIGTCNQCRYAKKRLNAAIKEAQKSESSQLQEAIPEIEPVRDFQLSLGRW
jgi:hypothetical protein